MEKKKKKQKQGNFLSTGNVKKMKKGSLVVVNIMMTKKRKKTDAPSVDHNKHSSKGVPKNVHPKTYLYLAVYKYSLDN